MSRSNIIKAIAVLVLLLHFLIPSWFDIFILISLSTLGLAAVFLIGIPSVLVVMSKHISSINTNKKAVTIVLLLFTVVILLLQLMFLIICGVDDLSEWKIG